MIHLLFYIPDLNIMLLELEDGSVCELIRVPSGSFFDTLQSTEIGTEKNAETGAYIIRNVDARYMQLLCQFLNNENFMEDFCTGAVKLSIAELTALEILIDRFSIGAGDGDDGASLYVRAMVREEWMRDNMYSDDFCDHVMNTDPHYNLHVIPVFDDDGDPLDSAEISTQLAELVGADDVGAAGAAANLLFGAVEWPTIDIERLKRQLQKMRKYTSIPGVFLAGGYVFAAMFGTETSDFDLFLTKTYLANGLERPGLVKTTDDVLKNRIRKVANIYESRDNRFNHRAIENTNENHQPLFVEDLYVHTLYSRTQNAITMSKAACQKYNSQVTKLYCQVILRVYKTYSEVLHGFDVDSCCMGFDGRNLLFTERAVSALRSRMNRVNFARMSPSYEYRLVKYAKRGIPIWIPGFTRVDDPTNLDKFIYYLRCSHKAWQNARGIGDKLVDISERMNYYKRIWTHTNTSRPNIPVHVDQGDSDVMRDIYQAKTDMESAMIGLQNLLFAHDDIVNESDLHQSGVYLMKKYEDVIDVISLALSHSTKVAVQNEDLQGGEPMEVFNKWKSVHEEKGDFGKPFYDAIDRSHRAIYRKLHYNVQGLNRLLVLERLSELRRVDDHAILSALVQGHSDYSPSVPFSQMRGEIFRGGQRIDMLCRYLLSDACAERYPDLHEQNHEFVEELLHSWPYVGHPVHPEYELDALTTCHVSINNVLCHPRKEVLCYNSLVLDDVLEPVDPRIQELIERVGGTWKVPTEIEFKRIQPGEQTTATFHRTVLDDPNIWYNGPFYRK